MRLYNKRQLEAVKFASSDETRQALHGLRFEGSSTIATNGHVLFRVTPAEDAKAKEWPESETNWDKNDAEFTVDKKTIEKAIKNIPKERDLPILNHCAIGLLAPADGKPRKANLQTTDLDRCENIAARPLEGKFPNYKQVIPEYKDWPKIGFDAAYLKEICAALEKYAPRASAVASLHLNPVNPQDNPLVITIRDNEGTEAEAILMPCRVDQPEKVTQKRSSTDRRKNFRYKEAKKKGE